MKTYFTKFRILLWVVIVLMVVNVSVIGTLLFRYYSQRRMVTRHMEMPMMKHQPPSYMKKELDLGDEQFRKFQEARAVYQESAYAIHNRIKGMRNRYLDELMKNQPDTALMMAMRDSIGIVHAGLLKATGDYYNQIRQLCNDKQAGRLNAFFKDAMLNEGPGMMPAPGMQHGMRKPGMMNGNRNRRK